MLDKSCSKLAPEREIKIFDPSAIGAKQKDADSKSTKTPAPKPDPESIEPIDE